jgi:hypothetical protein
MVSHRAMPRISAQPEDGKIRGLLRVIPVARMRHMASRHVGMPPIAPELMRWGDQTRSARTGVHAANGVYSITSSARASSVGGIVRPSALAALRLMTSSNLTGHSKHLTCNSERGAAALVAAAANLL